MLRNLDRSIVLNSPTENENVPHFLVIDELRVYRSPDLGKDQIMGYPNSPSGLKCLPVRV
jgi:hypothetical protein